MKKLNSLWPFLSGVVLGMSLLFGVGAASKEIAPTRPDWSRLKIFTYASGVTGLFDPATGRLYLYDSDLRNCYQVRQLTALGEPMERP